MRENAATKGLRYLTEGRVIVTKVNGGSVLAYVRGEGAVYRAGYEAGSWWCNCPARTERCAHPTAVRLVTAVDLPTGGGSNRLVGAIPGHPAGAWQPA